MYEQKFWSTIRSGSEASSAFAYDLALPHQHGRPHPRTWRARAFDGVVFHRVIDGFMAQGGDPTGTGTGGSDKPDLPAEFSRERHVRGTASMARSQSPDSANSQFFICFDDCGFLDGQYTVWGEVIEGMEHVDALPKGEPPREPGRIVKASLRD